MKIAVFGLGYVGCVTGACLAKMGHTVVGVDVSRAKVRLVDAGHSPVQEKGLEALVARMVAAGRLRATLDPAEALDRAAVSLVTVGTPSRRNGSVNLDHVAAALTGIGRALVAARRYHVVVVRSTIPPGTTENLVIPTLERASRRKAGRDFGVAFHPEFLREGSSLHDFFHPSKTVLGARDPRSLRPLLDLWKGIPAPLFLTSFRTAEIVKYADNAFHALKVSFANEIGALAKTFGIDGREVMRIFAADTKLNISPLYLRPGFAFGGPCLPKDVRALGRLARQARLHLPLIENVLPSNARHLRRGVDLVLAAKKKKVGVLGLVFKADTDDLRESPACALVKELLAARRRVQVYDPRVRLENLLGANRAFVQKELPGLPGMLTASLQDLIRRNDVIVLAGSHPDFTAAAAKLPKNKVLIDLVGLADDVPTLHPRYQGLAW
jgi:GDP-mannose 6-dehydrogenase